MSANIILQTGGSLPFDTWKKIFGDITPHQITYADLSGVTEIRPYAFYAAEELTYVELPCTIAKIGAYAFKTKIDQTLTIKYMGSESNWNHIEKDSNWAGEYGSSVYMIFDDSIVGDQYITYSENYFGHMEARASSIIQDDVDLIVLRDAYDSKPLYSIAEDGFRLKNCSKTIVLPYGIDTIGTQAFDWCSNLHYINLPNTITTLGTCCFIHSGIETIYVPNSVSNIGEQVFGSCSKLKSITIDANAALPTGVCFDCPSLKDVTLKYLSDSIISSHTGLLGHLFYDNSGHAGMLNIVQYFSDYDPYQTQIPASLETVVINGGVLNYGAFSNCTPIKYITLNNVTSIARKVFLNCSNLEYLKLPNTLTSIGDRIFDGCSNLKYIVYNGTKSEWGNITIDTDCFVGSSILYIECSDGVINL